MLPGVIRSSHSRGAGARHVGLAHVRHVEQAGAGARRVMLGDDAGILDRHLVPGEGHHARACGLVQVVERGPAQRALARIGMF